MSASDPGKLDRIVAEARRAAEKRELGYREQALKIYPWIRGRRAREFTRANVREGVVAALCCISLQKSRTGTRQVTDPTTG